MVGMAWGLGLAGENSEKCFMPAIEMVGVALLLLAPLQPALCHLQVQPPQAAAGTDLRDVHLFDVLLGEVDAKLLVAVHGLLCDVTEGAVQFGVGLQAVEFHNGVRGQRGEVAIRDSDDGTAEDVGQSDFSLAARAHQSICKSR